MAKKTLNIIPHSHWDREWYMGFDRHRVRLVELFDALIDTMEKHEEYNYYHMDGQFVVIEDYLEIKPEMKDRLYALIRAGRIQIGPWYVLQDEYLTSGESNVRNMLYGIKLCKSIGASPVMSGYFPDSFGNVSQAPQILNGFGIDNAIFGRGLNDLGSNNAVVKQNGITNSELIWQSPDGSEVIGIMFANWYHNAMELPTDPEALKNRIHQISVNAARFATTDQLLGMNGCDHQPVQTNLHEAIRLANEVQDEVYVRQTNFPAYVDEIRKNRDNLHVYRGEINGQYSAGHFLLINTASCRVDIKQKNHQAENLLARRAEPLNVISMLAGDEYRSDFYLYSWRKLMQNHPHDSICSCSADDVYDEMLIRFQKSMLTADEMRLAALDYLAARVDTGKAAERNIILFNLDPHSYTDTVTATVDFPEKDPVDSIRLIDKNGKVLPATVKHLGRTFTYTLPKDRFRQPAHVNRFEVTFPVTMAGMGYEVIRVEKGGAEYAETVKLDEKNLTAENETLIVKINENGSFDLTDKRTGRTYPSCNYIEDTKDKGNTYLYGPVEGDVPVTSLDGKAKTTVSRTPFSVTFRSEIEIAIDADIVSEVTLTAGIERADIRTTITNRAEDHRIRAMFPAEIPAKYDYAEGQFDLVQRTIYPWEHWENPYNTQRCTSFFLVESEDAANPGSLLIAGRGLNEYEIMRDGKNTLAETLLRCVGQIGDWGYFPTPKAQQLGTYVLEYSAVPYAAGNRGDAVSLGYNFSDQPFEVAQTGKHEGALPENKTYLSVNDEMIRLSTVKKAEESGSVIVRLYNLSEEEKKVTLTVSEAFTGAYLTGMDEKRRENLTVMNGKVALTFGAKKVLTVELTR